MPLNRLFQLFNSQQQKCFILYVLLLASCFTQSALAQSDQERNAELKEPIEMVVKGRYPGPPLWRVISGDHTLWIFAHLSPVPKNMVWDSSHIEKVISDSQQYLKMPQLTYSFRVSKKIFYNPDKKKLKDILPEELYTRYRAMKSEYFPFSRSIEKLRPSIAGPSILAKMLKKSGLINSNSIMKKIEKLAKRNTDLEKLEIKNAGNNISQQLMQEEMKNVISSVALDQEIACFDWSLTRAQSDVELLQARANAWAQSDVAELRNLFTKQSGQATPCNLNKNDSSQENETEDLETENLIEPVIQNWLEAAEKTLLKNESTFAVLSIEDLLKEDGFLKYFRDKGYTVKEPY